MTVVAIASTSSPVPSVPLELDVSLPLAGSETPSAAGPAVIDEGSASATTVATVGFASVGDLALEIQLLQSRKTDAQASSTKLQAKSNKEAQIASIKQRLEELARAADEKASSEKSAFWSKVFKWVAVAVAAIAGALSAAFSAGAGAAIAAVVIAVVLASETVVKAVTDALVECGAIDEKQASIINACFGVIEDIINQLAEAGAFGENGDKVAAVLNLVVGAAKAIVSCVVGGVSGVAEIVGAVCELTAEAVKVAQEVVVMVYEALDKEDQLSQEMMLALSLIGLCLDIAGAACSATEGGGEGEVDADDGRRERIATIVKSVLGAVEGGAGLGESSFGSAAAIDSADAEEAEARGEREQSRVEVATARIAEARNALEDVFSELNMVLDDVDGLMELDDRVYANALRL